MNTRFFPGLLALGLSMVTFGQTSAQKNTFNVSTGMAFPTGTFGKKDVLAKNPGFAQPGPFLSVQYGRHAGGNWQFIVQAQTQLNALDEKGIEKAYGDVWFTNQMQFVASPDEGASSSMPVRHQNWNFEKGKWISGSLQFGGQYNYPLGTGSKSSVYGRGLFGAAFASAPDLKGNSVESDASASLVFERGTGWGFAYSFAGGIQVESNNRTFFTAGLAYSGTGDLVFRSSKYEFNDTWGQPGSPSGGGVRQSIRYGRSNAKISNLLLTVGIGKRF